MPKGEPASSIQIPRPHVNDLFLHAELMLPYFPVVEKEEANENDGKHVDQAITTGGNEGIAQGLQLL
jgi:hypothetical protein